MRRLSPRRKSRRLDERIRGKHGSLKDEKRSNDFRDASVEMKLEIVVIPVRMSTARRSSTGNSGGGSRRPARTGRRDHRRVPRRRQRVCWHGSALPVWAALASVIKTVFFSMFISFSFLDLVSSANTAAGDARTLRNSQISACDYRWPIEMVIGSIVSG